MASQVQYRRGTNAQNAAFTGALAEITVDTTNGTLRVHDAITVGGSNIATVAYVTAQISSLSANSISSGTSNVQVVSSGGNITTSVGGVANVVVVATTGAFVTGLLSVTGNVQGGNIRTAGLVSATGSITGSAITGTSLTVGTGNVSCGNIVNANANGVGNIGSTGTRFNQIFALASSAQYADLAEKYTADADYPPGTVVEFGGTNELTVTTASHSTQVAGVISTNPAYTMNDGLVGKHTAMVALTGRVPCLVLGPIAKGDRLVASATAGHAQRLDPAQYEPGCIIGKALEHYDAPHPGTIEVAVGRF
jgi:hypothetical protein